MRKIDICIILEGTYPFVHGGVSSWVHEMILNQKDFTFYLICIVPSDFSDKPCFKIPDNVVGMQILQLTTIRKQRFRLRLFDGKTKAFFKKMRNPLMNLAKQRGTLDDFKTIVDLFNCYRHKLDEYDLLKSTYSWDLMLEIYEETMPEISFMDFFWSWRTLIGGLFSIMMADIPAAGCYHTICTGYAGILMARLKYETGSSCVLTEHGIYTSERRFEISFAEWLVDQKSFSMSVNKSKDNYELRDMWIDFFVQYGRFCYLASDMVISLFKDNLKIQVAAGAPPEKCKVIPNGINLERYGSVIPSSGHPPSVAFIGRITPIKDVKTYIRAVGLLCKNVPDLKAYIIGGHDESPEYYDECLELIDGEYLGDVIKFTGKVDIIKYLPLIDVVVLSSISEAQPLVILEAGAAGIPSVATNVGACREILEGAEGDDFGPGGIVVPLASPLSMSDALSKMLLDEEFYAKCSTAIKKRVEKYYSSKDQFKSYHDIYRDMINVNSQYPIRNIK
ncbi:MAG: GT4 family glycosyltransferase PelF [Victivallales bacterium]|jgi:glycosyltransferase involved in cell wall biosynthesis